MSQKFVIDLWSFLLIEIIDILSYYSIKYNSSVKNQDLHLYM